MPSRSFFSRSCGHPPPSGFRSPRSSGIAAGSRSCCISAACGISPNASRAWSPIARQLPQPPILIGHGAGAVVAHARRTHRSRRGRRAHRAARPGKRATWSPGAALGRRRRIADRDGRSRRRGATLRAGSSREVAGGARGRARAGGVRRRAGPVRSRRPARCPDAGRGRVARPLAAARGREGPGGRPRRRAHGDRRRRPLADRGAIAGGQPSTLLHRWLVRRLGEPLLELYGEMMAERDAAGDDDE